MITCEICHEKDADVCHDCYDKRGERMNKLLARAEKAEAENERLKRINIKSIVKEVVKCMTDCDDFKAGDLMLSDEVLTAYENPTKPKEIG